ncbi:hypothetical protein NC651_028556 [Populus alba x Populus x berolinensis]|nr:hypothetical protein NC651_028556 [Populus alba x Populus x berolinensis]
MKKLGRRAVKTRLLMIVENGGQTSFPKEHVNTAINLPRDFFLLHCLLQSCISQHSPGRSTNPSIFGSKGSENLVEQSPFPTYPADLFSSYFFDSLFMEGFSNRTSPFFDNLKGSLLRSHSIEMASAITEKGFLMFIAVKLSRVRNISVVSSLSNSIDRELFVSFNPFANMCEYSIVPNLLDNCMCEQPVIFFQLAIKTSQKSTNHQISVIIHEQ